MCDTGGCIHRCIEGVKYTNTEIGVYMYIRIEKGGLYVYCIEKGVCMHIHTSWKVSPARSTKST
jgi:hypothetical protein